MKKLINNNNQAFTLVELVVVTAILAVLATIGFVSYTKYLVGVRDTNRASQLVSIYDGLDLHRAKNELPLPDEKVEIQSNGEIISYQGYLGLSSLQAITYTEEGKDPKDEIYFTYYVTKDRNSFQLMGFLEEKMESTAMNDFLGVKQTFAFDYTKRIPMVKGDKLGILTDISNNPIQEVTAIKTAGYTDLSSGDANTKFIAYYDNAKNYAFSGSILAGKLKTLSFPSFYGAPKSCPEGFIGVPGDANFNQKGFCVAQYEMTYSDADTPNSCNTQYPNACISEEDWNTVRYIPGKEVISMAGKYPIVNIKQGEAINTCKSMGQGYHLITNNEWMAIARNIEMEEINWKNGVGIGYIPTGVSNDTTLGCNAKGGNSETRTYATKTGPGGDAICNPKRRYILSNAQIIWDFSGNVREYVNKANTIDGSTYDVGENPNILATNNAWGEWSSATLEDRNLYGPLVGINATNGIGRIYQGDGIIFLRGARAYNTSNTGIFTMNLAQVTENQNVYVGFRCAY